MDIFVPYGNIIGTLSVLALLVVFSWRYDKWIEKQGIDLEGYLWGAVVIGCAVTIVGIGILDLLLDWNAGFISALAFIASGSYMIKGGIVRHIEARRRIFSFLKGDEDDTR